MGGWQSNQETSQSGDIPQLTYQCSGGGVEVDITNRKKIALLLPTTESNNCAVMLRLTVDTAEMTGDHLLHLNQRKRTHESNRSIMLGLSLSLLTFPSLLLFLAPTPQPLYKSAQKTMWALAGSTVSFEWWTHTRLGQYRSYLCGTVYSLQTMPKYIYVVSILGLLLSRISYKFWVIPQKNMSLDSTQTLLKIQFTVLYLVLFRNKSEL